MTRPVIFLFLSAISGFFSIICDQYAYQAEKNIVDTELNIREDRTKAREFLELNSLIADVQGLITNYYRLFDLDYNYAKGREDFVIEGYDVSNLSLLKANLLNSLNQLDAFPSANELELQNLSTDFVLLTSPTTTSSFYEELSALQFFAFDQLGPTIRDAAALATEALQKADSLYSEVAAVKFRRQLSLLLAISFSLISLLSLFLFFRIGFTKEDIERLLLKSQ